jgi:hypothetical protein
MLMTWVKEWNDIIRDVIYPDEEIKRLMLVPEGTGIIEFVDRYFVRAGYTSTLLTNENVRIVYGNVAAEDTDVPNVKKNEMSFDIYVKQEHAHNASRDRLEMRQELIANRLQYLLTKNRYLGGYRFWIKGQYDLGTKTIGYTRYNISFYYMKVY